MNPNKIRHLPFFYMITLLSHFKLFFPFFSSFLRIRYLVLENVNIIRSDNLCIKLPSLLLISSLPLHTTAQHRKISRNRRKFYPRNLIFNVQQFSHNSILFSITTAHKKLWFCTVSHAYSCCSLQ